MAVFREATVVSLMVFGFGLPRSARAEETVEPIDLSYQAPEGCPSFSQFLAEAQSSGARLQLARAGQVARHFRVVVEPSGRKGQLTVEGRTPGERAAIGVDCTEVANLLAFATALAADPTLLRQDAPSGTNAPPRESIPSSDALFAPPVSGAAAQTAIAPPLCPAPARPVAGASVGVGRQWSVAEVGLAKGANAPGVSWGGGAFGELALGSVPLSPRFRLGSSYVAKTLPQAPGTVTLSEVLLMLETCSGVLSRGAFTLLPCLRLHAGAHIAAGRDLPQATSRTRGFFELGFAAHARWHFARPLFLELGGAWLAPVVRDTVLILPNRVVYAVPAQGALGELALGVEFGDQTDR